MVSNPLRVGIAGLGTVGVGVVHIVQNHADLIKKRAGKPVVITAVSARSQKDRGVDLSAYAWMDNPIDIAAREDVDCVVELIGSADGAAYDVVRSALTKGKHVVTANKALMSKHGYDLAKIAEKQNVSLNYEAAVAGGIPVIKAMRESLAGNEVNAISGILNGTSNYILTQMRENGIDFETALKDAQDKGYAEADPTFDIDGTDAAHKLSLLSAIAFGTVPNMAGITKKGMQHIAPFDIRMADELGYRIKVLGIADPDAQSVEPCLVPQSHPLYAIDGVTNAVDIMADSLGPCVLTGAGAGRAATASSVLSDIVDIARNISVPTFGIPAADLRQPAHNDTIDLNAAFYMRIDVLDQVGVVATVSDILKNNDISIQSMIQHTRRSTDSVPVVIQTHQTCRKGIQKTADSIAKMNFCTEPPCVLRILGE